MICLLIAEGLHIGLDASLPDQQIVEVTTMNIVTATSASPTNSHMCMHAMSTLSVVDEVVSLKYSSTKGGVQCILMVMSRHGMHVGLSRHSPLHPAPS